MTSSAAATLQKSSPIHFYPEKWNLAKIASEVAAKGKSLDRLLTSVGKPIVFIVPASAYTQNARTFNAWATQRDSPRTFLLNQNTKRIFRLMLIAAESANRIEEEKKEDNDDDDNASGVSTASNARGRGRGRGRGQGAGRGGAGRRANVRQHVQDYNNSFVNSRLGGSGPSPPSSHLAHDPPASIASMDVHPMDIDDVDMDAIPRGMAAASAAAAINDNSSNSNGDDGGERNRLLFGSDDEDDDDEGQGAGPGAYDNLESASVVGAGQGYQDECSRDPFYQAMIEGEAAAAAAAATSYSLARKNKNSARCSLIYEPLYSDTDEKRVVVHRYMIVWHDTESTMADHLIKTIFRMMKESTVLKKQLIPTSLSALEMEKITSVPKILNMISDMFATYNPACEREDMLHGATIDDFAESIGGQSPSRVFSVHRAFSLGGVQSYQVDASHYIQADGRRAGREIYRIVFPKPENAWVLTSDNMNPLDLERKWFFPYIRPVKQVNSAQYALDLRRAGMYIPSSSSSSAAPPSASSSSSDAGMMMDESGLNPISDSHHTHQDSAMDRRMQMLAQAQIERGDCVDDRDAIDLMGEHNATVRQGMMSDIRNKVKQRIIAKLADDDLCEADLTDAEMKQAIDMAITFEDNAEMLAAYRTSAHAALLSVYNDSANLSDTTKALVTEVNNMQNTAISFPKHKRMTNNLTTFGDFYASVLRDMEMYDLIDSAHRQMVLVILLQHNTHWPKKKSHLNIVLHGPQATSKSLLLDILGKCSVKGTMSMMTYISPRALFGDNKRNMNGLMLAADERPPGLGIPNARPGQQQQGAEAEFSNTLKQLLSKGTLSCQILRMDKETGARETQTINIEATGTFIVALNEMNGISDSFMDRLSIINMVGKARSNNNDSLWHTIQRAQQIDPERLKNDHYAGLQLTQVLAFHVEKMIQANVIPDVEMSIADHFLNVIVENLVHQGGKRLTTRAQERVRLAARHLTIWHGLHIMMNHPTHPFNVENFNVSDMMRISGHLVCRAEYLVTALGLMSHEFNSDVSMLVIRLMSTMENLSVQASASNDEMSEVVAQSVTAEFSSAYDAFNNADGGASKNNKSKGKGKDKSKNTPRLTFTSNGGMDMDMDTNDDDDDVEDDADSDHEFDIPDDDDINDSIFEQAARDAERQSSFKKINIPLNSERFKKNIDHYYRIIYRGDAVVRSEADQISALARDLGKRALNEANIRLLDGTVAGILRDLRDNNTVVAPYHDSTKHAVVTIPAIRYSDNSIMVAHELLNTKPDAWFSKAVASICTEYTEKQCIVTGELLNGSHPDVSVTVDLAPIKNKKSVIRNPAFVGNNEQLMYLADRSNYAQNLFSSNNLVAPGDVEFIELNIDLERAVWNRYIRKCGLDPENQAVLDEYLPVNLDKVTKEMFRQELIDENKNPDKFNYPKCFLRNAAGKRAQASTIIGNDPKSGSDPSISLSSLLANVAARKRARLSAE